MKTRHTASACALAAVMQAMFAHAALAAPSAQEAKLLATLRKAHPGTTFTSVAASNVPGMFEVWMGPNVAYASPRNPRYLIVGRIVDTATLTDITGPKLARAHRELGGGSRADSGEARVAVDRFPIADAMKVVRGSGARALFVFSDPACGYCKQLEPELATLHDVTIHTFVVPFQGRQLPQAVLCSPDPARSWRALMLQGDASGFEAGAECASAIDRNAQLARQLGVNGTPTLFYADGSRTTGYVVAAEIERRLDAATETRIGKTPAKLMGQTQ
jgi:thiol:disulfide interchange protein DsbC